ncbi:hypothetical protein Gogos_004360, partial [Gossypium gossypioides]|nr:hypothetical protein [Gossypium gossypioides]
MVPNVDGEKPISKVEHITTILNSLPSEYDPFMAVIIAIKESFPLQGVVSVLVEVETRQQTEALKLPIVVHATQHSPGGGSYSSSLLKVLVQPSIVRSQLTFK